MNRRAFLRTGVRLAVAAPLALAVGVPLAASPPARRTVQRYRFEATFSDIAGGEAHMAVLLLAPDGSVRLVDSWPVMTHADDRLVVGFDTARA